MIRKFYVFLITVMVFGLCSCTDNSENKQMKNPPKHVIMIGLDGMSANSLNNGVDMPTYRSLMRKGAYTLKNRSILPSSSACNWASMFMGASSELHGFNTWGSKKPDFPSRVLTENGFFPDIFYLIRKTNPNAELAHFYEWTGMYYLVDTLSIDVVKQVSLSADDTKMAVAPVINYITKEKPNFCTVIFDQPDGAGHKYGWESKEYYATLNHLDNALKQIVEAVENAGMMEETIFILTSDHGGKDHGHGGPTLDEMQTPIVFYGKGIKQNYHIEESTMIYDIPATIGYIFGVQQPQVWIGRPILSVFE